mmetsp:Transcript_34905/g.108035  ORF Transcript_34905/g.108035 Transcript_34905/m.108035 type:complete len:366 (+) Transcript_34905:1133-2230(+)
MPLWRRGRFQSRALRQKPVRPLGEIGAADVLPVRRPALRRRYRAGGRGSRLGPTVRRVAGPSRGGHRHNGGPIHGVGRRDVVRRRRRGEEARGKGRAPQGPHLAPRGSDEARQARRQERQSAAAVLLSQPLHELPAAPGGDEHVQERQVHAEGQGGPRAAQGDPRRIRGAQGRRDLRQRDVEEDPRRAARGRRGGVPLHRRPGARARLRAGARRGRFVPAARIVRRSSDAHLRAHLPPAGSAEGTAGGTGPTYRPGGPHCARVVGAHYPARAPPADPLTGARRRRKRARRPDGLCRFRRRAPCGPSRVRAGGLDARPRAQPRRRTICAAAGRATELRPRAAAMNVGRRRGAADRPTFFTAPCLVS